MLLFNLSTSDLRRYADVPFAAPCNEIWLKIFAAMLKGPATKWITIFCHVSKSLLGQLPEESAENKSKATLLTSSETYRSGRVSNLTSLLSFEHVPLPPFPPSICAILHRWAFIDPRTFIDLLCAAHGSEVVRRGTTDLSWHQYTHSICVSSI